MIEKQNKKKSHWFFTSKNNMFLVLMDLSDKRSSIDVFFTFHLEEKNRSMLRIIFSLNLCFEINFINILGLEIDFLMF